MLFVGEALQKVPVIRLIATPAAFLNCLLFASLWSPSCEVASMRSHEIVVSLRHGDVRQGTESSSPPPLGVPPSVPPWHENQREREREIESQRKKRF